MMKITSTVFNLFQIFIDGVQIDVLDWTEERTDVKVDAQKVPINLSFNQFHNV